MEEQPGDKIKNENLYIFIFYNLTDQGGHGYVNVRQIWGQNCNLEFAMN